MLGRRHVVAPLALIAGAACVVLVLTLAETPATSQDPGRLWGDTSLGVPVPWPADFDSSRLVDRPRYSPSGRYMALCTDAGRPLVLDLATSSLHDIYERAGCNRPNLDCVVFTWLSDKRLWLFEHGVTDEEFEQWEPRLPLRLGEHRHRVIDWQSGATILERSDSGETGPRIAFGGRHTEDEWIVRNLSEPDWKRRWWLYDVVSESFVRVLVECTDEESLRDAPRGAWIPKLLIPWSVNHGANTFDMEFINYRTGEVRRLNGVPPQPPRGQQITADGRYVVTSAYVEADCRWAPIVFDTETGQRHDLPDTESWFPVALSESRGVLLVGMTDAHGDGTYSSDWAEIPLSALLPP